METQKEGIENVMKYPFRKMHSREFQGLDLTNLVSYFNHTTDCEASSCGQNDNKTLNHNNNKQNGLNNSNDSNINLFSDII